MFAIVTGRVIGEQKESEFGFEFTLGEDLPKNKDGTYQKGAIRVSVKDPNDFIRKYVVSGAKFLVCASDLKTTSKLDKEGQPVTYKQAYVNAAYVKMLMPAMAKDDGADKATSTRAEVSKSKKRAEPIDDEDIPF